MKRLDNLWNMGTLAVLFLWMFVASFFAESVTDWYILIPLIGFSLMFLYAIVYWIREIWK